MEKTSMHDGHGLRTVIYLKGCPLRCSWCSTPESHSFDLELGYNPIKCNSCLKCVDICPEGAITPREDGTGIQINKDRCTHCFACARACPSSALKGYGLEKTVQEIIREVEKDEIFYLHSGGGVTLTGGEPLAQVSFVREILRACLERGIDRALETSGFVPWESFDQVLPLLNLLFFDVKQMDPVQHRKLTGQDNSLILENLRKIDSSPHPTELIVRVPLIPGLNDSPENLLATAEFCKSLKRLKGLELLPYHRFGIETYAFLGREYALKELRSPDEARMEELLQLIRGRGLSFPVYSGTGGL